jgi:hypothetical protein
MVTHHLPHQILEPDGPLPPQQLLRLGRVAQQLVHLGWAEVLWVYTNEHAIRHHIHANLLRPLTEPPDGYSDDGEGFLDERPDRVVLPASVSGAIGRAFMEGIKLEAETHLARTKSVGSSLYVSSSVSRCMVTHCCSIRHMPST